ncbi:MAG: ABC transporter substrate-binding protein [Acidimicrobiia bacterium]
MGGRFGWTRHRQGGMRLRVAVVVPVLAAAMVACTDDDEPAAPTGGTEVLDDAQRTHFERFGVYADERELVEKGLLPQESPTHEISVSLDRKSYSIGPEPLPPDQQELTVGFQADPWTTATGKRTFGRFSLDAGINETLTRLGEDYSVQPGLATRWEVIPGGTNADYPGRPTWRFHLRPGVKFHSGADFTAADVKWSLDRARAQNLDTSLTMSITGPSSVVVVDPLTVDITPRILTGEPAATNLRLPESFVHQFYGIYRDGTRPELYDTDPAGVMDGTGPFRFESYAANENMVVTRNDGYWGPKARASRITFRFIPDETTRRLALESGSIDAMVDVGRQQVAALRANGEVQVVSAPPTYTFDLYMNVNGVAPYDKLRNENVRRALALSLDREEFVRGNWDADMAEVVNHVGPPSALGTSYGSVSGYAFNLNQARNLLDDEGWTCGGGAPRARTACRSGEVRQRGGESLQLYLLANRATDDVPLLEDLQRRALEAGIGVTIGDDGANRFTPRKDSGAWDLDSAVPNQNDANPAFLLMRQWWSNATQNFVACWAVDTEDGTADGRPCPYPADNLQPPNLPYRAGPWQAAGPEFDGHVKRALEANTPEAAREASAAAMDVLIDRAMVVPLAAVSRVYGLRRNVAGFEPVNPALSFVRWTNVYKSR